MLIWSPEIVGNEYFRKVEEKIVKLCGLNLNEYCKDKTILTKELWDKNFDKIVLAAIKIDATIVFQSVGLLAIQTQGKLPTSIYSQIMKYSELQHDKQLGWKGKTAEVRKEKLKEFRERLTAHYDHYIQKYY